MIGPDYFFGVPVQNLSPDRDKVAWSLEARAAAIEVFPKWFESVKTTYGRSNRFVSLDTLPACFSSVGTETTKYVAVGECAVVHASSMGQRSLIVEPLVRLLFWRTVRAGSSSTGVHLGR